MTKPEFVYVSYMTTIPEKLLGSPHKGSLYTTYWFGMSDKHVTHHDGFTDLWRMLLWTAVKAEMYGDTERGWWLVRRMVILAQDAQELGRDRPSSCAWSQVREEVTALKIGFGSGAAGECLIS